MDGDEPEPPRDLLDIHFGGDRYHDYKNMDENFRGSTTVFVGNIPYETKWRHLKEMLNHEFGRVRFIKFVHHVITREFMGCAYVRFRSSEVANAAHEALLENGVIFHGRLLRGCRPRYDRPANRRPRRARDADNQSNAAPFCLDEDSLTQILSYLDPMERLKMERVSTMWQRCSKKASRVQKRLVVENPTSTRFGQGLPESKLCKLISVNSHSLVELDLSPVPSKVKKSAIVTIASCCHKLERLDISRAYISNHGITSIVVKCNKIKYLKVEGCPRITEKGFWNIFKHCKQLESLICYGNRFSGNCLRIAPASLREVELKNCDLQRERGVFYLSERCKNLTKLNLNNCRVLLTQGLTSVLQKCLKLEEVDIGHLSPNETGTMNFYPIHPVKYLGAPQNITKLMIDNTLLQDGDLMCVFQFCVNVRELDVSCNPDLTNVSVMHLGSLAKLEILNICHLHKIDGFGLVDVISRGQLKILRMQGCKHVADRLFEMLAELCCDLEELDIAGIEIASLRTLRAINRAHAEQTHRRLMLYTANNAFLALEQSWVISEWCPINVSLHVMYRHLYATHSRWVREEEETEQDQIFIDRQHYFSDAYIARIAASDKRLREGESTSRSESDSDESAILYVHDDEIESSDLLQEDKGIDDCDVRPSVIYPFEPVDIPEEEEKKHPVDEPLDLTLGAVAPKGIVEGQGEVEAVAAATTSVVKGPEIKEDQLADLTSTHCKLETKEQERDLPMDKSSVSSKNDITKQRPKTDKSGSSKNSRKSKSKASESKPDIPKLVVEPIVHTAMPMPKVLKAKKDCSSSNTPNASSELSVTSDKCIPPLLENPPPSFLDNLSPRPLTLPDYDDDIDSLQLGRGDFGGAPAGLGDEGADDYGDGYFDNDYDEFLDNDDPLEQERWDRG